MTDPIVTDSRPTVNPIVYHCLFPSDAELCSHPSAATSRRHYWLPCAAPCCSNSLHYALVDHDELYLDLGTPYGHVGAWDEMERDWRPLGAALWCADRSEWRVRVTRATWPYLLDVLRRWQVTMGAEVVDWLRTRAAFLNECAEGIAA